MRRAQDTDLRATRVGRRHRLITSLAALTLLGGLSVAAPASFGTPAAAAPTSPTDETKVPHYFGPWPNWANSPFTLPTANVAITGDGSGATATASVDAAGAIAGITVTDPGSGYTTASVDITGTGGAGAAATAHIATGGAVTDVTVPTGGGGNGYKAFSVALSGGSPTTPATVTGSGGVDAVTLTDPGSGYTMPTVDFDLPDDPNGTVAKAHVEQADLNADGSIAKVTIDDPGSGYTTAPGVAVHNGTLTDPITGATPAVATTTLSLAAISVTDVGAGYTSAPDVTVTDPVGTGSGATAAAKTNIGAIDSITVDQPGSGYLTVGMKKFQDQLPLPCAPAASDGTGCPSAAAVAAGQKFLPLAVPETKPYNGKEVDEYVIGLVQYRTRFSSDLPPTLVRGYVQLSSGSVKGQEVPLANELLVGDPKPIAGYTGVTSPQWLGPIIPATKDRPVRIVFRNLLPNAAEGDLFLPTDSSMMGSGMVPMTMPDPVDAGTVTDKVRNPDCTESPKPASCFKDNRATLHLHGGTTPWISDGTPHQWITPANEQTSWPQGVSVSNVPDMTTDGTATGPVVCDAKDDGCQTFYYTNQQSARLMFYHDHSWGITRLNVYAGEAAGYLITDTVEQKLVDTGTIPGPGDTLPLIVQDRTFVPGPEQLKDVTHQDAQGNTVVDSYGQDPTWDTARWGTKGSFWYHHVYMPAQNPGDPSGMSAYGRWMYGPWFWPPATGTKYGPIDNPYYDPACDLDKPGTWQYQTDPFCEPKLIPGTPNVSAGMEQFNDTPIVNGMAYPTTTVDPKSYRLRMLNAANDRFFNFQWYTADPDPKNGNGQSEVALKPAELAAAQTDLNVFPTPIDAGNNTAGPDWIQIGSEGGFLPAPTVVDGQQPTTWITDPTRFDVGNVDKHSLLLAPAERADVIVDFSEFAGKTLILYNDAPAAFPARVPSYDYYTGAPDMRPNGAPSVLPGYGPNTRTIMQVKVANTAPAPAFDLAKLQAAFKHHADGSGVFESGQHPVIVGQAAYNSAYGSSFAASGNCSKTAAGATAKCDGLVRVDDTAKFQFNTLKAQAMTMSMPLEPKAIHDEMNSSTFDEFGRMQANLGIEAQPPTPGGQNVTLYPYVNPQTELIDGTNLPSADVKVTPISDSKDGSQIWRITHNGVDTHPIHFHLYDVQVLNRVTWDNIIIPTEPSELGWKDTVRISPLEDTIVALRPIIPKVPFEVPNSVRPLNPMMPIGSQAMFNNIDPQGNPTNPVVNQLVNFGWEYVYHCHILSHEEMDMMRPVSLALPPAKADGLTVRNVDSFDKKGNLTSRKFEISWNDNSINETSFLLQRTTDGNNWVDVGTSPSPLDVQNTHGTRTMLDATSNGLTTGYLYRVVARNAVGYGAEFPSMTVKSVSDTLAVNPPAAPTNLTATLSAGPRVNLSWRDNATSETGFVVERQVSGSGTWAQVGTVAARSGTGGTVSFTDTTASASTAYLYRVGATNVAGTTYSNTATINIGALPGKPAISTATAARSGSAERITVRWADVTGETGYTVQWSSSSAFTNIAGQGNVAANATVFTTGNIARTQWFVRVVANNAVGSVASDPVSVAAAP